MLDESGELNSSRLFKLAVGGDAVSLDALLALYIGYLHVLARSHFDQRLQQRLSATDVVQDTLLEAHRDFANFSGASSAEFTGWIRKILVNNMARQLETHLLAAKRDVRRECQIGAITGSINQSHQGLSALLVDQHRGPASEADHQESLVQLASAIDRLSPQYREVIVLRHLEGNSFPLIAKHMNRTIGATRMLWLRAIERLRSELTQ